MGMYILLGILLALAIVVVLSWSKVSGALQGLRNFFSEVGLEMNKVTWPSTDEVINSTVLVFIVAVVMTLMVMVVDGVFARVFGLLLLGSGQS